MRAHTPMILSYPSPPHALSGHDSERCITLADGAVAELSGGIRTETLRFLAPGGSILFEYDARTGRARIHSHSGGLEVTSGSGDLVLRSDSRVRVEAEEVEITGREGVNLATEGPPGRSGAEVSLKGKAVAVSGAVFAVTAGQGDVRLGRTHFVGERVGCWIGDARLTLRTIQTLAGTVIRKARDVYDSVDGLCQLKTSRFRTLVRGTWLGKSRNTVLTAEEDFSIDGQEIHLG